MVKGRQAKAAIAEKSSNEKRTRGRPAGTKQPQKRKRIDDESKSDTKNASQMGSSAKKAKASSKNSPLAFKDVSGVYTVLAPAITEQWPNNDHPLLLELRPSSTESHLWGAFDFGAIEGNMRSKASTDTAANRISFHWRGRETGEGESTFGDENIAELSFTKGGEFQGAMYCDYVGTFKLTGKLDVKASEKAEQPSKVAEWKSAYRELTQANYDRESDARMPGSHWYYESDEDRIEPCSDSDVPSEVENKDGTEKEGQSSPRIL